MSLSLKLSERVFWSKPESLMEIILSSHLSTNGGKEEANRQINFEDNINVKQGNLERAAEDFGEVVRLYPHLSIAREALDELS